VKLNLRVWRQDSGEEKGRLVEYEVDDAAEDMSFLELIDVLNETMTPALYFTSVACRMLSFTFG